MASSRGASVGGIKVATTTTSPKGRFGSGGGGDPLTATSSTATGVPLNSSSPKGQCLCSPTTHQGSFRCKFHRATSTAYFKRSKSMPPNNNISTLSPKSVESA